MRDYQPSGICSRPASFWLPAPVMVWVVRHPGLRTTWRQRHSGRAYAEELEAVYDEILAEQLAGPLLMPLIWPRPGCASSSRSPPHRTRVRSPRWPAAQCRHTRTLTPLALYDLETVAEVMPGQLNAAYLLTRAFWCAGESPDASVIFTLRKWRAGTRLLGAYAVRALPLENLAQVWADD